MHDLRGRSPYDRIHSFRLNNNGALFRHGEGLLFKTISAETAEFPILEEEKNNG